VAPDHQGIRCLDDLGIMGPGSQATWGSEEQQATWGSGDRGRGEVDGSGFEAGWGGGVAGSGARGGSGRRPRSGGGAGRRSGGS
jgi:hypothetical protein